MSRARATRSICDSSAKSPMVTPNPRMALDGVRLVNTQWQSAHTFGIVYGPGMCAAALVVPYGLCRA